MSSFRKHTAGATVFGLGLWLLGGPISAVRGDDVPGAPPAAEAPAAPADTQPEPPNRTAKQRIVEELRHVMVFGPDGRQHIVVVGSGGQSGHFAPQAGNVELPAGSYQDQLLKQVFNVVGQNVNLQESPPYVPPYVIGVGVTEVPSVVWSQLQRSDRTGVLVAQVMPDSPAAVAGVQVDDIILKANDRPVLQQKSLTDVVQAAVDKPVSLLILRGGQEMTIEAIPKVNEAADPHAVVGDQRLPLELLQSRVLSFGPGLIVADQGEVRELKKQVESLNEQLQALQKSVDELQKK